MSFLCHHSLSPPPAFLAMPVLAIILAEYPIHLLLALLSLPGSSPAAQRPLPH